MSAPSSDHPSAPPTAPPPPPPPSGAAASRPPIPAPKSKRGLAVAVGVVIVVVLLLVALALAGVLHTGGGSSSSSPSTSSEQSAAATAGNLASAVPGGPWSLIQASGSDTVTAVTHNASSAYPGNSTCYLRNGTITSVTVPAYSGNYSNGMAQLWLFYYYHDDNVLLLVVQNGTAHEVGQVGGPGCFFRGMPTPLPAGLIDSSAAARAAAGTSTGASFVASNAHANASYVLWEETFVVQGVPTNISMWEINYQACSGTTSDSFSAEVYATNGSVLSVNSNPGGTCGAPHVTPIGAAFAAGNPISSVCPANSTYAVQGCTAGDYTYRLTIEASSVNLSSVLFEVKTASGAVVILGEDGGFTVQGVTGGLVAQSVASTVLAMTSSFTIYSSDNCGGSACGPSTALTSVDTIFIDMGTANPAGDGYSFVVIGIGDYSGTTAPLALP